ncbi:hypothetical protein [Listeria ilorinensis]|uniref:hypothetical protein n=1 Tax=Listeria ilorinensis TaxID=2867439 RepID=UPI001EF53618|nr:hypothetical protein [Listeria ilorinensis]
MWLYEKNELSANLPIVLSDLWTLLENKSNISWRSNVIRVQTNPSTREITEFYPHGQLLRYQLLTQKERKYRIYRIEHRYFSGYLLEEYHYLNEQTTRITLTEKIRLKNDFFGVLSKIAFSLKQGQTIYLNDLESLIYKQSHKDALPII